MKYVKFIFVFVLALMIGSCKAKKSDNLIFKTKNSNIEIHVEGIKHNVLDPWQVNVLVQSKTSKRTFGLEIYSVNLSKDEVHCIWEGEKECKIVFNQQDGVDRTLLVKENNNGILLKDLSNVEE